MEINELVLAFEAVLFAGGEPISIERLSQIFEIPNAKVKDVLKKLADKMEKNKSGLELLQLENSYQLATKNEYYEYIKRAFDIRRRTPLSAASLEVLAVIAYNQPVTRSFVEQVRGVDCSGVITTLVEKGLIEERGRLELPGKPLLYGTTKNFLRCFNLSDLADLPAISKAEQGTSDIAEQLELINEEEQND